MIYARTVGIRIESCIFDSNTREIYQYNIDSRFKFIVIGCVFSGDLPAGDFYDEETNNQFHTETASYTISVLATLYCPTASPWISVMTRTPIQSSGAVITQTTRASPTPAITGPTGSNGQTFAPVTPTDNPPNVYDGVSPGVWYGAGAGTLVAVAVAIIGFVLFFRRRNRQQATEANYDVERQSGDEAFGGTDRFLRSLEPYGAIDGETAPLEAFSEAVGFRIE
jgi:hypothetical protein